MNRRLVLFIVFEVLLCICKLNWILTCNFWVSSNIWLQLFRLTFLIFSPPSDLEWLRTEDCPWTPLEGTIPHLLHYPLKSLTWMFTQAIVHQMVSLHLEKQKQDEPINWTAKTILPQIWHHVSFTIRLKHLNSNDWEWC